MGGGDTLFASVRIRNSASNDKYLFAHAVNHSYNWKQGSWNARDQEVDPSCLASSVIKILT